MLVLVLLKLQSSAFAQSTYQFGGLPSINLNNKLKNNWSVNTKVESRQLFQRGDSYGNVEKKYQYVLTDFSLIAGKKVGLNSRILAGFLIRVEDDELVYRSVQQYIRIKRMSGFRLAHRVMSDQTFSKTEKPEFRLRYRITSEIPLNGESVDPGEFYLKLNNEYINSIQSSEYDLEIRLVPLLGYNLSDQFKIESGLDYRVNSFLNNNTRNSYWIAFNFFIEY